MQPVPAAVRNWLIVVASMIFFMIVLGALTRLTESGLSMVEWKPVTGCHSTMDSPDSVSRVRAPMTIIKKIIAATTISQLRTDAGTGCMRPDHA